MSTQVMMLSDGFGGDSAAPFATPPTANNDASGHVDTPAKKAFYTGEVNGIGARGVHAGIQYIDEEIGGYSSPRGDASAYQTGFRSFRQRHQPFTGATLGGTVVTSGRIQGRVGAQSGNRTTRVRGSAEVNPPTQSAVTAAFMSPALLAFVDKIRRR